MSELPEGIGIRTRIVHMLLFEFVGLVLVTPFAALILNRTFLNMGAVAIIISVIAMLWNFSYNWVFDAIEKKMGGVRFRRSLLLRSIHAVIFEGGLFAVTIPIIACGLDMSLLHAILVDIGGVIFFMIYAFVFNWVFDRLYLRFRERRDRHWHSSKPHQ